ncbi:MAG: malto-oligosyltrehalose trehalohydrolase [Pseudacidovorax sp.]|uniref:malto-oligosyltrehalose trehalohydrolase n=1 Tax=Pseudacidovorax sp. TaxID=1934311 RepID=UPI001B408B56|nr:malto-oligosyltrehalose trehalohydrolase [Pseudacidovorax sp.]MBP6897093.1 malto-oligosyltrehalose trehalohydrolase [Pseudacidovorax sp.]
MRREHKMPFGATVLEGGGVRFRLWAPGVADVVLERRARGTGWATHPMKAVGDEGWFGCDVPMAAAGDDYRFVLPDGLKVPDPASRHNPDDVHGPSRVVAPAAYEWHDDDWQGRPWREAVVYELHIGSFTPEGTFDAARKKLPELAALGITAIEMMPVADFPGTRGWGYDGVLQFAPEASYGRPEALKAFVDTAHGLGLMVLLDVVYNHFGPEGNYLHAYCPQFFNPAHQTPWGAAINYDGDHSRPVRDFFVHNALYWIEEFRFDGLRMDAVHAIRDDSELHIVCEITEALRKGPGRERAIHVVLENEHNHVHLLTRDAEGRPHDATAQWNDDFHHAAHVQATGEIDGYYLDYASEPKALVGRALAGGFIYTGQPSVMRDGDPRGEPTDTLPPTAFVSFLQNHDQIGNRAFGERIEALAPAHRLRALRAALLLSPHVPLMFMGEEWAATAPFLYFCDFGPELAQAVTDGRRREFGRFEGFTSAEARARIPDPNAESTFTASRLDWAEREQPGHRERVHEVRTLLAVRKRRVVPHLPARPGSGRWQLSGDLLFLQWEMTPSLPDGLCWLQMVINLGDTEQLGAAPTGRVFHSWGCHLAAGPSPRLPLLALSPGGGCAALLQLPVFDEDDDTLSVFEAP